MSINTTHLYFLSHEVKGEIDLSKVIGEGCHICSLEISRTSRHQLIKAQSRASEHFFQSIFPVCLMQQYIRQVFLSAFKIDLTHLSVKHGHAGRGGIWGPGKGPAMIRMEVSWESTPKRHLEIFNFEEMKQHISK